jgi:hypothetical protein
VKKARKTRGKKFFVALLVLCVLSLFIVDYITLPVYNLHSFDTWILLAVYAALFIFLIGEIIGLAKAPIAAAICGIVIAAAAVLASAASWLVWPGNSARYYGQLAVADKTAADFAKDFPDETSVQTAVSPKAERFLLPRTDKQLSTTIAQSKLGNYGARFRMDTDIFTAMAVVRNGKTEVVRVSPLDYTGTMVALSGGSQGTAGYIEVNQTSEESRLVPVSGGMKYTPGAILSYDLDRHIRFGFRGFLLGAKSFEIDDTGKPYWIVPVVRHTVGLFAGPEQDGLILVDPASGDMRYYLSGAEPSWVDRAIPTDMVVTQANNHLKYKNGWINTVFGEKRDVFQLSDSYNYIVSKGEGGAHTWLISGVTSPSETDQTLVGFMMVNMKTKEARRYAMSGITEMRAMEIAQNDERVRAQSLQATWPILVNVGGEGAYYLFLKNNVQRQRFVYVDLATGQKVAMSDTLEGAKAQFEQLLGSKISSSDAVESAIGVVLRVKDSPSDGKVVFLLAGQPNVLYSVDQNLSNGVRFLAPGDRVEIGYRELAASKERRFVVTLRNLSIGN